VGADQARIQEALMPLFTVHYLLKKERVVFGLDVRDAAKAARDLMPIWEAPRANMATILQVLPDGAESILHVDKLDPKNAR
jgi:hypothetical protein